MSHPTPLEEIVDPYTGQPAEDIRELLDLTVVYLECEFIRSSGDTVAFYIEDELKALGFLPEQVSTVTDLLQEAGLMACATRSNSGAYFWVRSPVTAPELPMVFIEAAWQRMKSRADLHDQVGLLNRRLLEQSSTPSAGAVVDSWLSQETAVHLGPKD